VDILIATPGRLMDHLSTTPNFTLQHLRFLIIDEADRLLNQSFQNWLSKVLSHLRPPTGGLPEGFERQPWDRVANGWLEAYGLVKPVRELSHKEKPSVCLLLQRVMFCTNNSVPEALVLRYPHSRSRKSRCSRPTSTRILYRPVLHPSSNSDIDRRAILPPVRAK